MLPSSSPFRSDPAPATAIGAFERKTGIPVILNTSFNKNEPIVLTPEQALDCFKRTRMDELAIGLYLLLKTENW
jgi:carbamoyltransferase